MGIANPVDSLSTNTTVPTARPYAMPALNGLYFPVLQTSNLTTATGLSDAPSGLVASVKGKAGTGTLSFPTLDTTKPFRIAVKITMGDTGGTDAATVRIVNADTGGGWQIGTTGNQLNDYFINAHLTNVPAGTVIWFSFASDGTNLMACMVPDKLQSLWPDKTPNSAAWPPAGLDCIEQTANVPADLSDRKATTSINRIVITSSSTATVVNGIYLSAGRLDGPSDSKMLPPMVLNTRIGLDAYNGAFTASSVGSVPPLTEIVVPGNYGTPDGTPVVLVHHPYGNANPPQSSWSTLAALFNDGYMIVIPTAMADYGGDGNYMNALASNWGAPSGLLIRKQAVDWVRQNLPASWQLYEFGTSMGCINSLEYEKWWPGTAAIACVSGVTSLSIADSAPYGTGRISSIDATSFSGFYVALQASTGQNPSSAANFWKQISVAPGFMDEMYLNNPPYNFADTWSATKTYSTGQIVAVPYAGSLASLAPYDPTLNPQTYAAVPVYMSTCNTDQPIAAENQAFYDALHAIGGDVTLQIISDGSCGHQSADLFFPSATVSFFDRYRKHNAPGPSGTTPPQAATTATTLSITSAGSAAATVASGSSVTLTAAVQAGGAPVTAGQVSFCDSDPSQCTGIHVLGTAQLTAIGTAAVNLVPAIGDHSYTAVFAGTDLNASSISSAAPLTVTGLYPSATTIAQSGSAGSYALTATVTGTGAKSAPSGTVSFLDGSDGNNVLATAVLGSGAPNLGWVNSQTPGTGQGPGSAVVADFNGDGRPDLAVANLNSNTVTVQMGRGDGTFSPGSVVSTGSGPDALAVGDFNGDGKPDLAVANFQDNSVTLLLGNGDGTFAPAANAATGAHPAALAAGDFNRDGNLDLAVVNSGDNTVTVLLGNGEGTFARSSFAPVTGAYPDSIAVGDFNGDGDLDLAVANGGSNSVTVLRGNGDGTFTPSASPPTGSQPVWVTAADFNRDGAIDLAVVNFADSTITILLGVGDATFAVAPSLVTGANPEYAAALDFDRDGNPDLAVATSGMNSATLLQGKGDGTFAPFTAVPTTGSFSNSVAAGDFNSDGGPDLAITNFSDSTVTVLLSKRTAAVAATATGIIPLGTGPHLVRATYSGDGNYFGSVSSDIGLTAQQVTPALTWGPPAAIVYGTQLSAKQLNAGSTVPGTYAYSPAPGTVLSAGAHTLTVTFTPDDPSHYTSATATVPLAVVAAAPAITWASPAAITYGTALSAAQLNGSSTVAGTYAYSPALGTVLPAGTHTLSVTFTPTDLTDYTAATTTVTLTVNKATQTITLTPLPSALTFGSAAVPVTATSSSGLPVALSTTGPASLDGSALTITGAGTVTVTVSQTGDTNYSAATSVAGTIDVAKATPTAALAASSASVIDGSPVTFTATVTGSGATPTGMVTFYSGTILLGASALGSGGTAALTVTSLGIGSSVETVSYAGDGNFTPATSPAVGVSVLAKPTPAITLTSSASSIVAGFPVTLTATVTGTGANSQAAPTGTVLFVNSGSTLGAVTLGGSGAATLEVTSLPLGTASMTATYAGDGNFAAATSSAIPITVTAPVVDFTVAASPSSRSVYIGQTASYTITVTPVSGSILPVTLTCSQVPANASCSFLPVTGGNASSSTLLVQTTAPNNSTTASLFSAGSKGMALATLLLFFLPLRVGRFRKRWPAFFVALALSIAGSSAISGCGGTYSIATGTPAGAQRITVTAAANNGSQAITHEVVLTLNVMATK